MKPQTTTINPQKNKTASASIMGHNVNTHWLWFPQLHYLERNRDCLGRYQEHDYICDRVTELKFKMSSILSSRVKMWHVVIRFLFERRWLNLLGFCNLKQPNFCSVAFNKVWLENNKHELTMPWRRVSHTSSSETDGPINWRIYTRIRETLKLTKGANVNDNEILKTVVRDVVHHILRIPSIKKLLLHWK